MILFVFVKVVRKNLLDFSVRSSGNLIRLLWSVATYDDLTPSGASSGCLGPSCCLGVPDALEGVNTWIELESVKLVLAFDCNSSRFDVWDFSSEDIF